MVANMLCNMSQQVSNMALAHCTLMLVFAVQVKYAALDVLVAGQVFRALRLWHSSPSMCEGCHYYLGSASSAVAAYACSCGKSYKDIKAYLTHCERAKHEAKYAECSGCGCARPLPWPSSASSGSPSESSSSDGSANAGDNAANR